MLVMISSFCAILFFLTCFLSLCCLQEEKAVALAAVNAALCPVYRNFQFTIEHTLTCTQCGHVSKPVETFRDLSVEIPEQHSSDGSTNTVVVPTVQKLLQSFWAVR